MSHVVLFWSTPENLRKKILTHKFCGKFVDEDLCYVFFRSPAVSEKFLKVLNEDLFFSENTSALCPWSLASDFFCVLGLVSSTASLVVI